MLGGPTRTHERCEFRMRKKDAKPDVKKLKAAPATRRKRLADDRIAELLDIAAEVFIADGFAAASTNEMARRANASKTTFYSRFPTKKDLFLAVVERRMTSIFEQVARFPEQSNLESTLRQFGLNLLRIALSPQQVSLIRMIGMEAGRYPELAGRFYENGPKRGEEALASYLARQISSGQLRKDDPRIMARHFMSLITGSPVRWFVLGFDPDPIDEGSLWKHVDDVLRLFLHAYGLARP
jgi:TetR/AcrR family transcriptional regulator, mexJK operon transcriptional repressor